MAKQFIDKELCKYLHESDQSSLELSSDNEKEFTFASKVTIDD